MKRNRVVMLIVGLLCAVLAGTAMAQSGKPSAPGAAVGTAFTYQGQIDRNGALYTGTCDLQFSLWDAASAGTQQGATLTVNAASVDNGVFTVELDFGNQFTGAARWLETAAMCADDVNFTTLPRIALNPALYAVSLIPGAQIEGSISAAASKSITSPQSPNLTPSGIINAKNRGTGPALVGTSGANAGVWGSSVDDSGVYGESTNWHGVTGVSLNQVGVTGSSTNFDGVWGDTSADNAVGVAGWGFDPCTVDSTPPCFLRPRNATGVSGQALANGTGVFGRSAAGNGVWGEAQLGGYGVLGHSATGVSVAGFATGYDKPDLNSSGFGTPAAMFGGPNGVIGYSKANGGNGVSGVARVSGSVGIAGYAYDNTGYAAKFYGKTATTILEIQGGGDLAELFDVSHEKAEPGTLMIIDVADPGHLTISRSAYDTRVAGIVSGAGDVRPGLILHQEGVMEGDTQVAIAGRVYVKATSSNGSIKPGDLLTTSDVPGYAMKATDHDRAQGAVIGKAMTGLTDDTGLVLVLVNLQ